MSDNNQPRGGLSQRRPRIWLLALLPFVLIWAWFSFFIESVYQRRKAEAVIAGLKTFPFASAKFFDVREFVLKHGGHPVQQSLPFTPRVYGSARVGPDRKTIIPFDITQPACTTRDCDFELVVDNGVYRLFYLHPSTRFLTSMFQKVGIRPWVLEAHFSVADGMFKGSRILVGQIRSTPSDDFKGLAPIGYIVNTSAARDPAEPYKVGLRDSCVHFCSYELIVQLAETESAPARRAFDIDLHCLTVVRRPCTSFAELAPSAWADYLREQQRP